jgi:UDP-glucose 4-epimerase
MRMARGLRVLVTGGSGFIGSHVVDRLLAAGHRPRIFDVRPSAYHPDVPAVVADLEDLDAVSAALEGCDAVIHLAASADVNEVLADPLEAERRNARGTICVLEAARRCSLGRVVYASTIWAYSDTPADCHEESLPLCPPAHLYTATKLAGEMYCHSYRELYGVESTILRFGIPYGPRARPAAVLPSMVKRALAGEALTIAGDGSQSRRFVYVEDLAEGVVRALAPVAANRTYNLVSEVDVTIRELAETVRDVMGDVAVEFTPGRIGDFAGAPVSGARAAAELGWRATTPIADGVRRYVEWRREAPAATPVVRDGSLIALARRAAIALAWAVLSAVMIIGLVVLTPVEPVDRYDIFFDSLVLLAPLVLAGGFTWEEPNARRLGRALWALAGAWLAVAIVPWPSAVDIGRGHSVLLMLFALTAAGAARLVHSRPPLPAWLGVHGE